MKKDNRLYYIICVTEYVPSSGIRYQILTNKKNVYCGRNNGGTSQYKTEIVEPYLISERQSPYYCNYTQSYYKFDTFKEAMDKAIELVKNGVLPNIGISKNVAEYGKGKVISIIQRPLGDIIGYRYAEYLEKNKDNKDIKTPKFKADDVVYLTNIGDGDVIYKTIICDCELNEEGEWQYYTTYWPQYPYDERSFDTEEEFKKHIEIKPSGNMYYYYHRVKIVEI